MKKIAYSLFVIFFFVNISFADNKIITILHTNDFHSHYDRAKALSYTIDSVKKNNDFVFLIDAGDRFEERNYLSYATKARIDIEIMNAMGYDIFVPGDNDFYAQLSRQDWVRMILDFNGDLICANIIDHQTGKLLTKPYTILEKNNIKIAFIGLYDEEDLEVQGLRFLDTSKVLEKYLKLLRKKCDILILVSHEGIENDRKLAQKYQEIDLIVSSSDNKIYPLEKVSGCYIQQAGKWGDYLGKLDIEYDTVSKSIMNVEGEIISVPNIQLDNPKIANILDTYGSVTEAADIACRIVGGDLIMQIWQRV